MTMRLLRMAWVTVLMLMAQAAIATITLNMTSVNMKVGESVYITAKSSYSSGSLSRNYDAENNGVVKLYTESYEGTTWKLIVSAINEGTTTIIFYDDYDRSNASCTITVKGYKDGYMFSAETVEGVELDYVMIDADKKTCRLIKGPSKYYEGALTIPRYAKGFEVIEIADSAFMQSTGMTGVTIPSSVVTIGKDAFYNKYGNNLATVNFSEGLTTIGDGAFESTKVTSVKFPSTLTKIGDRSFSNNYLESISGHQQLEYIGADAFDNTPLINNLPASGPIYIGKVLYKWKMSHPVSDTGYYLTLKIDIKINEGTKMISGNAFGLSNDMFYSSDTISITIPASCTYIQNNDGRRDNEFKKYGVFFECPDVISVAQGNPVYDSRDNCGALIHTSTNTLIAASKSTMIIPSSIRIIDGGAFRSYCNADHRTKTKLIIPNSVDSIGEWTFASARIDTIVIGSGVSKIGFNVFQGCEPLSFISVDSYNKIYDSRDNCSAIIDKRTNKLVAGCSYTVIPTTVKSIGDYAFGTSFSKVKTFTIPDNVEEIGNHVFSNASYAPKILILGKGIKKIGRGLTNYRTTDIGMLCNMPPNIITESGDGFYDYPTFTSNYTSSDQVTLYVPQGSLASYMMADGWKEFKNIKEGQAPILVQKVSIDKEENYNSWNNYPKIELGKTLQLTATVLPENATNKKVVWKSNNEDIATVSADGVVTGIKSGTVSISCTSDDDSSISDYITIGVFEVVKPTDITLPEAASVAAGETVKLTPQLTPSNAMAKLTWTSFDETIATVDSEGVVTGVKKGQTFITVTTDNGLEANLCKLTVTEAPAPDPIKIEIPKMISVSVGQKVKMEYTLTPENAKTTVTWEIDAKTVATIDSDGFLTGLSEGLAIAKATTANGITSNQCGITVTSAKETNCDVNGDGTVNVADIASIIDVMAGKGDEVTEKVADVNGDGAVNVADISTVISRMAELARLQHTIVEE